MITGLYDATGALTSTFGDTTYTGLYMPDGSLRVHTDASTGLYSASGGIRVTIATSGTTNGVYAPDGSLYVVKSTTDTTPGLYGTYGSIRMTAVDAGAVSTAIIQSKSVAIQTGSLITPTWTSTPTNGNLLICAITG
jgi:hypothetical protein